MPNFELLIAGKMVPGAASLDVINPATGKAFTTCPDATPAQLDAAVASANEAFLSWREDEAARRAALGACSRFLCRPSSKFGGGISVAVICRRQRRVGVIGRSHIIRRGVSRCQAWQTRRRQLRPMMSMI